MKKGYYAKEINVILLLKGHQTTRHLHEMMNSGKDTKMNGNWLKLIEMQSIFPWMYITKKLNILEVEKTNVDWN